MKTKLLGTILMVLMIGALPAIVVASGYDSVVVGTGDPAVDVPAVQVAVDQGGRILLKGTFDFGDWGTVAVLTDNVEIHGKKVGNHHKTKIIGGQAPFLVGSSAMGPLEWIYNPGAIVPVNNFAVQNIFFEDPIVAIAVLSCHGNLRIIGNKIVDGRPVDFGGYPLNMGVYVGSVGAIYDPTVVTGVVAIENNYIDGRGRSWATQPEDDPWAVYDAGFDRWYRGLVFGISFSNVDAHVNIVDNEVVNTLAAAISLNNGIVLSEEMTARITGNTITPSPDEYFGDPLDVLNMSVYIAHNALAVTNPNSWGVACVSCYDSLIEKNSISYNGGWLGGVSLVVGPLEGVDDWPVSGNIVRNNKIAGKAAFAIAISPYMVGGEAMAENNTFVGNNISGFTPDPTVWGVGAHYLFMEGANNNLVVGNHGDVIDLGEGNVITGLTKKPGNIGQQMKDALQRKKELMK